MSRPYPLILTAPTMPGAIPCFRSDGPPRTRQAWDERCTRILVDDEGRRSNAEIAALIEAATGMRFDVSVISRYRRSLGVARPRRNEWTSALRRWKPWQGHLAGKS